LNFESPGAFFDRLTERRWAWETDLQGQGEMAARELARRAGSDLKRVHEGVRVLIERGMVDAMTLVASCVELPMCTSTCVSSAKKRRCGPGAGLSWAGPSGMRQPPSRHG
jgi:hypothetical protein